MTRYDADDPSEYSLAGKSSITIPAYLLATYWWAYIHPWGVRIFERQWLVNLILWGNYKRLCDAVLQDFTVHGNGRFLQIACAYGNLTPRLAENMDVGGALDVIDILPVQLNNLAHKLKNNGLTRLHCMDATALDFPARQFDHALLFFLLHEQPLAVRQKTLAEAVRVLCSGGVLTIVDYARPSLFNPLRYFMIPVLILLEPYALDMWHEEILAWMPQDANIEIVKRQRFFGGLYQKLTIRIG